MNNNLSIAPKQLKSNTATFQPLPELLRVSKRNPCQICGKPDFCGIAADNSRAVCMRIQSDRSAANGGFVHYLDQSASQSAAPLKKMAAAAPSLPKASAEHHHAIYSALLDLMELSDNHQQDLIKRGLNEREIAANGYKSLNQLSSALVEQLSKKFDLSGVAGFYQENGKWQLKCSPKMAGFLVPYRNERGAIAGLQIRADFGDARYFWLSSKDLPQGAGSGSPEHFVNAAKARQARQIIITEGALKADLIAHFTGEAVCALAGVANWSDNLPERLIELGAETALIAFDSDFITNDLVLRAINNLGIALQSFGIKTRVIVWQKDKGKGLDNFLASNHQLATDAEEISFLDWRERFEPQRCTIKPAHMEQFLSDPDISRQSRQTIKTAEKGAFHNYAEIATLLAFMMRLAGFSGDSQRLVETVVKAVGLSEKSVSMRDQDLSDIADVATRSIQRWRAAYKAESFESDLSFIEIQEGEYQTDQQRYAVSRYRINPALISTLEDALCHLYEIESYDSSPERRQRAIEKTAKHFLSELPVAKIKKRRTTPTRKQKTILDQIERIESVMDMLLESGMEPTIFEFEKIQSKLAGLPTKLAELQARFTDSMCPRKEEEEAWTAENNQQSDNHNQSSDHLSEPESCHDILSSQVTECLPLQEMESCHDNLSYQVNQATPSDNDQTELPEAELCSFCSTALPDGFIALESLRSCISCHAKAFTYTTLLSDSSVDFSIKKAELGNLEFQNKQENNYL